MERKLHTDVQQANEHILPDWQFLSEFRKRDKEYKKKQKKNYDKHYRTRSLDPLSRDSTVWVRTGNTWIPGTVTTTVNTPRSYLQPVYCDKTVAIFPTELLLKSLLTKILTTQLPIPVTVLQS